MGSTNSTNKTFAKMSFAKVYPMYLTKVEKKDRAQAELHKVITWLTGFDDAEIQQYIDSDANLAEFFDAATLNPNAKLITGVICELLSNLVFEACRSCGDLVGFGGFNSVFERDTCDDFGKVVKSA